MHLMASDGDAGIVEDILTAEDGTPRYLIVRDRGVFARDVALSVDQVTSDGTSVRTAMSRKDVHAADRFDVSRHGESAGLFSSAARTYDRAQDESEGHQAS
jgi:hypothetical protein